ncbi:hypothetical protein FISHEDRAFT_45561 [Fistulina hepatica ATCC 64428]|uniref:Uncharacterized protein n=1 Tax=Fistulina hepatica ATCC 64428 TaxID=1128425 RepID=A0A0D7A8M5_9AGAR|nr:hypothetical protein FISHEDRAFT_45561 [Fistulina hepatica ATCC 64428]
MSAIETSRLLQAAAVLSQLLRAKSISHAFYGSVFVAALANSPYCDEMFCIVEGGQGRPHAFRRVRDAIATHDDFMITMHPWTNRYHIEILPAGETGPRILSGSAVMKIQTVPFLSITEFIRAKLKSWSIRGSARDVGDILFVLTRYWNRVDINRIPENDMNHFVAANSAAASAWLAVIKMYRT